MLNMPALNTVEIVHVRAVLCADKASFSIAVEQLQYEGPLKLQVRQCSDRSSVVMSGVFSSVSTRQGFGGVSSVGMVV